MKKFLSAYENTIKFEGIYSNDVNDRGGETYKGISRKNYPDWKGWDIVDAIKKVYSKQQYNEIFIGNTGLQHFVEQFYYENFWLPLKLDSFDDEISLEVFDTAVNQGKHAAATYLQKSLNKLNRNEKDYQDILVDGQIGYNTIKAYQSYINTSHFISRNKEKLIKWLLKWLNYYQLKKYDYITDKNHKQEIYIPGWTERT